MKKFNLNMIIGKRQIILACLVMILGVAVYLNWQFAKDGETLSVTGKVTEEENQTKNYGDAALVDANGDYFAQARYERQKARDEAEETLSVLLDSDNVDDMEKAETTAKVMSMAKLSESESKIESLIKAKGFKDCVVYLDGEKAKIVVKTDGLDSDGAMAIRDIVVTETGLAANNIQITEVK